MAGFEILDSASSGQELIEYAHQAEAYINNHTRKQRKRIKDAISELNSAAADMYFGSTVMLSGIMIASAPDLAKTSPENRITSVAYGNITGNALGFRAIDLHQKLDEISPNLDEDGLEIVETLRSRAYGRYAVCHLIDYDAHSWESDDYLADTNVNYRVLGPISSSYLFADGVYRAIPKSARHREVAKIVDLLSPQNQMRLNEICMSVAEGENMLESFTSTSEVAKVLFTDVNAIERDALIELINLHIKLNSSAKNFCFTAGMPISLIPIREDECDICKPDSEELHFIKIEGVAVASDYNDVEAEDIEVSPDKMQLFVKAITADSEGAEIKILVPAQYVANYTHHTIQEC